VFLFQDKASLIYISYLQYNL